MATQNYHSIKNAALITPATATDLGSVSQPYGNLFLQGNITLNNATTITSTSAVNPKITSVSYPGVATAADPAGGQTITINGSGFASGATTYVAGAIISVTNFVSSTQLTFTAPAKTAGSYTLSVVNTDGGTASYIPGLTYSALPVWSTAAGSLGSSYTGSAISTINLSASENAQTITYAVTSGTLPTGLSLSSVGALTGTPTGSAATYNFTVTATDPQNQTATRNFSYTLSAPPTVTTDVLIVAGGGGGGLGGGGGGGILYGSLPLTLGVSYTITVGGGGNGGATGGGQSGSDSLLGSYTAVGGGGGGNANAYNGGSGGGAPYTGSSGVIVPGGASTQTSVSPLTGYGYAGGTDQWNGTISGGGGGGAGSVGQDGYQNGPNGAPSGTARGGSGASFSITGTSLYYAGGGGAGFGGYNPDHTAYGGSGYGYSYGGNGGIGGGGGGGGNYGMTGSGNGTGGGSALNPGQSGQFIYNSPGGGGAGGENTGGGGGGACINLTYGGWMYGGRGGKGVVIISVDSTVTASSTTGSPTVTTPTGKRVYMFTSSGSITF
jgi:hypothetical protein